MLRQNKELKYESMKKAGISDNAIEITKKLDSSIENITIEKYDKMLKVGVPEYAINYQKVFDDEKNKIKEMTNKLKDMK
jgi:hypothetical protein